MALLTMTTPEAITLMTAMVGAVLGVLNTWQGYRRDRVRLKVQIRQSIFMPAGIVTLCITVRNVGFQPVTVTAIGLTSGKLDGQIVNAQPGNERLPHRLEPRTALDWYADPSAEQVAVREAFSRAYVKTACGIRVTSSRRFLRQLRRHHQR